MSVLGLTLQTSTAIALLITTIGTAYLAGRPDITNTALFGGLARATCVLFIALGPLPWLRSSVASMGGLVNPKPGDFWYSAFPVIVGILTLCQIPLLLVGANLIWQAVRNL